METVRRKYGKDFPHRAYSRITIFMKTILVNIGSPFFIRNFLRTEAMDMVKRQGNTRMVFLVPQEKLAYYKDQFRDEFFLFDVLPEVHGTYSERIFKFLESQSIHTRTVAMLQRTRLWRHGSTAGFSPRLGRFCLAILCWQMGRFRWWRQAIRKLYMIVPNHAFDGILDRYTPDVVFCPNMIYAADCALLKAARKRKIITIGMLLSWDNFYSKTFLRVQPDWLMVHTDIIREHAVRFGDYPSEQVYVVGIPQYDRSFRRQGIIPRDEFIRGLGGDPAKKLIVYAFSGKNGLHLDFDMVEILYEATLRGEITEPVNVLIRPYPKFDLPSATLEDMHTRYGFLGKRAMAHVGKKGEYDWEFDETSLDLQTNTLAHADVIITMYSTFFIEGAIFDKPLIAVAFDAKQKRDYWNSAKRFFEWNHLHDIKPLNGIWIAESRKEFIRAINEYLQSPAHDQEGRRRIVSQQCQFTDGNSARRVASFLLNI